MKNFEQISLSTILLFILGTLFLKLTASTRVDYFVWFFVGMGIYYIFDVNQDKFKYAKYRSWVFIALIFYVGVIGITNQIILTRKGGGVHDVVLQTNAAVKYLAAGENPYALNYFNTELEKLSFVPTVTGKSFPNPAMYHIITLPFELGIMFLASLVIRPFDVRWIYIICYLISVMIVFNLGKNNKGVYLVTTLFALNPLYLYFTSQGRNDIFTLCIITIFLWALIKNKLLLASTVLGLAMASKHSAWVILPFYFVFLLNYTRPNVMRYKYRIKKALVLVSITLLVFGVILLPFIIWDFRAFWDDIFVYTTGKTPSGYPINGYGLSNLLVYFGLIKDFHLYVRFWIGQIIVGVPLFLILVRYLSIKPSVGRMLMSYGIFLFVLWFFSRYFNDNYFAFISQIFLLAYFIVNIDRPASKINL